MFYVSDDMTVTMNGTEYHFTNADDKAAFGREFALTPLSKLSFLVEKYLSKLQRVVKRVIRAIVRMAMELVDSDNYWRGVGAATYCDTRRYL